MDMEDNNATCMEDDYFKAYEDECQIADNYLMNGHRGRYDRKRKEAFKFLEKNLRRKIN